MRLWYRFVRSDLLLKLKMLWLCLPFGLRHWWTEVWKQDAGAQICCSGQMCGCYGADYYSQWEYFWRTR